ncbi:MAG TPA: electron transfer flavoprotein subunit beta/FixA family protein [Kiritimatiellia bacterium]|nr:electron transfer flavoprotein subunit beta/FixA family protein [Kiritimatiellia bacterium]HNS81607.1 electron transfer flavoprotein subunit beta/FixA family protein [Kiritimatiellia bacterium]HPA79107.1 electron transfer flavoprotein subunit beta/FixA family protein [Kiritimatiellia bacterium]HQQ05280.1 electron transfer flavoprotein subunit beta/FixA family protein [Kiritimatiellia bacterium]
MHVVVCIKQVPDTSDVKINPETNTLIREGVQSIINPFDENALEIALVLKDTQGAKVTVITMGPPQAESALRECLARGADEVVLVSDRAFAGSDTLATSYTLARAIETLDKPDLILFGKQAIDGDTAQVGPGVAELLDMPVITYIRRVEVAEGKLKVERVFEDGYEKMEVPLPAVLTILKEANVPRMASLKGRMKAKKAEIAMLSAAAIQADPERVGLKGSPTKVVRIFTPPKKTGGIRIDGTHPLEAARTLVEKLREQKVI